MKPTRSNVHEQFELEQLRLVCWWTEWDSAAPSTESLAISLFDAIDVADRWKTVNLLQQDPRCVWKECQKCCYTQFISQPHTAFSVVVFVRVLCSSDNELYLVWYWSSYVVCLSNCGNQLCTPPPPPTPLPWVYHPSCQTSSVGTLMWLLQSRSRIRFDLIHVVTENVPFVGSTALLRWSDCGSIPVIVECG